MISTSMLNSLSGHLLPIYSLAGYFFQHPPTLHLFPYRLLPATWAIMDQREDGGGWGGIPHISPDRGRLKFDLPLSSPVAAVGREPSPLTLPPLALLLTFLFLSLGIKGNGGGGQEAYGDGTEERNRQTGTGGKHLLWQVSNGYSHCQPWTRT